MINQSSAVAASSSQAEAYNSPMDHSWLPPGFKALINERYPNGLALVDLKEDYFSHVVIVATLRFLITNDIKNDFFRRITLARANPSDVTLTQQGILSYLLLGLACMGVGVTLNITRVDELLKNKNLDHLNLQYLHLEDLDLTGMNLDGIDFSKSFLNRVIFRDAKLNGANMSDTDLEGVIWNGAELNNTIFDKAKFGKLDLRTVDLRNARLNKADFSKMDFDDTQLELLDALEIDGAYFGGRLRIGYQFPSGRIIDSRCCAIKPSAACATFDEQSGSSASADAGPAEGVTSPATAAAGVGLFAGIGSSATGKQSAAEIAESQNITSASPSLSPSSSSAPG